MSCSHDNDAGVKCLGFEDVHSDNDACPTNMTEVNGATSTTSKTTESSTQIQVETMEVCCETNSPETEASITEALGALTGLLAATLVIITIGWVVSFVYLMRKIKQR